MKKETYNNLLNNIKEAFNSNEVKKLTKTYKEVWKQFKKAEKENNLLNESLKNYRFIKRWKFEMTSRYIKENNLSWEDKEKNQTLINEYFKKYGYKENEETEAEIKYRNLKNNQSNELKNYEYINYMKNDLLPKLDYNLFKLLFKDIIIDNEHLDYKTIIEFIKYDQSKKGENYLKNNEIYVYYSYYNEAFSLKHYLDNYKNMNIYTTYNGDMNPQKLNKIMTLNDYIKLINKFKKLKNQQKTINDKISNLISENNIYSITEHKQTSENDLKTYCLY